MIILPRTYATVPLLFNISLDVFSVYDIGRKLKCIVVVSIYQCAAIGIVLVATEYITGIYFLLYIVQAGIVAVSYNGLTL